MHDESLILLAVVERPMSLPVAEEGAEELVKGCSLVEAGALMTTTDMVVEKSRDVGVAMKASALEGATTILYTVPLSTTTVDRTESLRVDVGVALTKVVEVESLPAVDAVANLLGELVTLVAEAETLLGAGAAARLLLRDETGARMKTCLEGDGAGSVLDVVEILSMNLVVAVVLLSSPDLAPVVFQEMMLALVVSLVTRVILVGEATTMLDEGVERKDAAHLHRRVVENTVNTQLEAAAAHEVVMWMDDWVGEEKLAPLDGMLLSAKLWLGAARKRLLPSPLQTPPRRRHLSPKRPLPLLHQNHPASLLAWSRR